MNLLIEVLNPYISPEVWIKNDIKISVQSWVTKLLVKCSLRRISLPSFFGQPPSASGPEGSPAAPLQPEFEDPFAAMEREVQSALPSGFGFGSSTGDIFGGVR